MEDVLKLSEVEGWKRTIVGPKKIQLLLCGIRPVVFDVEEVVHPHLSSRSVYILSHIDG